MMLRLCLFAALCGLPAPAQPPPLPFPAETKLRKLVIPSVRLDGATLEEAVGVARAKIQSIDPEPDPKKKGVNIAVQTGPGKVDAKISLDLKEVSALDLLGKIAESAGLLLGFEEKGNTVYIYELGAAHAPPRSLPEKPNATQKLMLQTLEATIIPKIRFDEATLDEALQYLRVMSERHSPHKEGPKPGIGVRARVDGVEARPSDALLTLDLTDVPLAIALDYVCGGAGLQWTIAEDGKIEIGSPDRP